MAARSCRLLGFTPRARPQYGHWNLLSLIRENSPSDHILFQDRVDWLCPDFLRVLHGPDNQSSRTAWTLPALFHRWQRGAGTIFASGIVVLISYFTSHLNAATGIAAAGGSAGGILFPLMVRSAVTSIGFEGSQLFAPINLLNMDVADFIVRERPVSSTGKSVQHTESRGSTPIFKDLPYVYMTLGMAFTLMSFFVAYYYIVLYGQHVIGLSGNTAIDLLVAMNTASLIGRFIPAFLSHACKSTELSML